MSVCMFSMEIQTAGRIWMEFGTEVVLKGRKVLRGDGGGVEPVPLQAKCLAISTYFNHKN